jgi:hypothetical protein
MKSRIRGGIFTDGIRIVSVKPTKEGYELTEKGVCGVWKIRKDFINYMLLDRGFKRIK